MDKRIISVLQKGGGGALQFICKLFAVCGTSSGKCVVCFFFAMYDKLYCMRGPRAFEGYLIT